MVLQYEKSYWIMKLVTISISVSEDSFRFGPVVV